MSTTASYVDLYTLPVPEENLEAYREQATAFGKVVREHGALSYREFRGDDLGDNLKAEAGVMLTAAVVEFESRAHRDEVMAKVLADPRVAAMTGAEEIAHMSKMTYGGFEVIVDA